MNTYRKMLAAKIESNGGYSDSWAHYAIEFNVALDYVDMDIDNIYKIAVKEGLTELPLMEVEWDANNVYEWSRQCATQSLLDDCGYQSYGVPESVRFGLPYFKKPRYVRRTDQVCYHPAKLSGWIIKDQYVDVSYEVELGLYGRGGKHLCISKFEGHRLDMYSEDLVEAIMDNTEDRGYSNHWCQKLLAMLSVWEKAFTQRNASNEIMYQAAHSLVFLLEEKYEELEEKAKQAADIELAYQGV